MIKYILIDFGGTFFTHGTPIAMSRISKILKLPEENLRSILRESQGNDALAYRLGKIRARDFWKNAQRKLRIDEKTAKRFEYIWHSSFKPNKGMTSLVKRLKKMHKIFVISGNTPDRVKYLNKKYHVNKLFDGFFFSFDLGVTKPSPKFLKIALERLKAKPKECLLIDDSKEFNAVAKKLGINCIVFKNAAQLTKDLNKLKIFG